MLLVHIDDVNRIAVEGLRHLPRELYEVASEIGHPDAIMVRSANMHEMDIPESVKAVADYLLRRGKIPGLFQV